MNNQKHIGIVGAGLIGSLLSIYLRKRGYQVSVFERRPDPRGQFVPEGRSINLALSNRGLCALAEVDLQEQVKEVAIPMHGRMMHDMEGNLSFLAYGKEGQYINSVSRSGLNDLLLSKAEAYGAKFFFNHRCVQVDSERTLIRFQNLEGEVSHQFDILIGADGAFSAVRGALQVTDRFDYAQTYIEHGYKELTIPTAYGSKLERNALHIWPRKSFMMIALPNPDGSFTCTLFFPFQGELSFESLRTDHEINDFFNNTFRDAVPLIPDLLKEYHQHPSSSLITIRCFPWVRNKTLLIGDAAHAIVPFYGQGMNAGFEDCRILNELLTRFNDDWDKTLPEFQKLRKQDADAIAQLALDNFIEMRDHVADTEFLLRKKIEAKLHALYPEKWIPLYSMVTFNENIRYSDAYATGLRQRMIMDEVMRRPGIANDWESLDFQSIINKL